MIASDGWEQRLAALQTPWVEAVYLPLVSALVAGSLAAVCLRFVVVVTGMATSWPAYVALLLAAASGAAMTTLCGVLDLPKTLRLLDGTLVVLLGVLILYLGPAQPGAVMLGGRLWSVSLLGTGTVLICLAWCFASSLAWVVPKLYPFRKSSPGDEVLEERLKEQEALREVYSRRYAMAARIESWRGASQVISAIFLVYLVPTLFWVPAGQARADMLLSLWTAVALLGVLAFLGLVHLAATRRIAERSTGLAVVPGYSRAWGLAVLLPSVAAAAIGLVLPSNISPLAYLDWNDIMDRFTRWVVGWGFAPTSYRAAVSRGSPGRGPLGGGGAVDVFGGSGGSGPIGIIVVLAIPLALYVLWRGIKGAGRFAAGPLAEERERGRGLLQLLRAAITWPWRALSGWWQRRRVRASGHAPSRQQEGHQLSRGLRARRARLRPEDPALYVRFMYRRMLQSAAKAGLRRRKDQTALEFAGTLGELIPETEKPVHDITGAYCHVRYTGRPPMAGMPLRVAASLRSVLRGLRTMRRA